MDRLRRKPGVFGLGLGGLVLLLSTFFAWLTIENAAGDSERIRAASTVTGQTIFLLGFLAIVCGLGVLASEGGGRIWFALLGLVVGAAVVAAAIWGLVNPEGLASQMVSSAALQNLNISPSSTGSISDSANAAFSSDQLSASAAIGAIIGLAGGVLILLGALFSFRKPVPRVR